LLYGFENFLRGPSKSELHALANGGSIVVFNVSYIRSDAFLITADEIRVLHLPLLTMDALSDSAIRFSRAVNHRHLYGYNRARSEANAVLEWLWDVAVGPILDILGFTQTPPHDKPWPRVWWVGSGLLNIFPIHAAGYHDSISPKSAIDRVISSYAPTLKSLAFAQERARRPDQIRIKEKALLIAMPTTPEADELPFVKTEIGELKTFFSKASWDTTIMWNPTRTQVLSEIPKHTIVHFPCHGYPSRDPSQSSFLLEDWKTESLKVSDLTSLNIELGEIGLLVCMSYFRYARCTTFG
jgi:CHAT domain